MKSSSGTRLAFAHTSCTSRKNVGDAVGVARGAFEAWAGISVVQRGQILYRIAEILEDCSSEMVDELIRTTRVSLSVARQEVQVAVDRLIWYAGWSDKLTHFFGTVSSVASSHFNLSVPEPAGVVCILTPDQPSLLGLISLIAPAMISGNTMVILVSEKHPLPSMVLAEILATSNLPRGVVNILTGFRAELATSMASHMDVNVIIDASGKPELRHQIQRESAANVKRVIFRNLNLQDWFQKKAESPYWILDTLEIKTTWHPIGF